MTMQAGATILRYVYRPSENPESTPPEGGGSPDQGPPPEAPPPLAPLVTQQQQPAPGGEMPSAGGQMPPPMAPPAPPAAPQTSRGERIRSMVTLVGALAFFGFIGFMAINNPSAGDLEVGHCFNVPSETEDISTVEKKDCTAAHDAEVFFVGDHSGSTSYPLSSAFETWVDDNCIPAFTTYVGRTFLEAEELNVGWFYPNREGWDDGDREVTCYIVRTDNAKMTQSVKIAQ